MAFGLSFLRHLKIPRFILDFRCMQLKCLGLVTTHWMYSFLWHSFALTSVFNLRLFSAKLALRKMLLILFLELQAALPATRLKHKIEKIWTLSFFKVIIWTDSTSLSVVEFDSQTARVCC